MTIVPVLSQARLRRVAIPLVVAAALALVGGLLMAGSSAGATGTLLSQGKPVTASSIENAGTPASAAVDGNPATRWSSAFSDPQWLAVDLGQIDSVTRIVLNWETAYARTFQIQISTDATTWWPITAAYTGTGGQQTLDVATAGRYVRFYGLTRATGWGYSLREFQVYGTPGQGPACLPADVVLKHPAVASSTQNSRTPASAAVDGDSSTRWSSTFSDPQWIQVDLTYTQNVCQVELNWEAAYAKAFQIQISNDGTIWTTIYSTTTGTGGNQVIDVNAVGRYLRVYGTARATGYGYSLFDLSVHSAWILFPPPGPTYSDVPTTVSPPPGPLPS
jgi:beta-glucosidase